MYKNILVPLDGSELAEMALPHVEMVAKASGKDTEVIVLRVAQPPRIPIEGIHVGGSSALIIEQAAAADKKEAEEYLADVSKRLKAKGLKVRVEIRVGNAAEEILDFATSYPVDLICMASHGRSGISRFAYGSVTSKVLRSIPTPTLVVTPLKK